MKINKYQTLAFLFGLGSAITVRIIGIFAISDLISLFIIPYIFKYKQYLYNKIFRSLILYLVLWMFSAIVSDIYNNTNLLNSLKGFFTLIPFLTCIIYSYWLLKKDINLMSFFLWGYSISFMLSAGFGLDAFYSELIQLREVESVSQLGHYNKIIMWIVSSFISGAFALSFFSKFPKLITFISFSFSFFILSYGSRSIFLIFFIVSLLLFYFIWIVKLNNLHNLINFQKKLPLILFFFFLFSFLAKEVYSLGASSGFLGESEKQKYDDQLNTKLGLFSGRGEIISAFLAIKDSPIFGHGSYAVDNNGYGYQAAKLIQASDITLEWNFSKIGENYIPTHSHLGQAWVYNGIFGGVFWFFVLFGVLGVFVKKYLFLFPKYQAYILFSLSNTIWNILFSPFSQRPFLAISIVFFIVLMEHKKPIN